MGVNRSAKIRSGIVYEKIYSYYKSFSMLVLSSCYLILSKNIPGPNPPLSYTYDFPIESVEKINDKFRIIGSRVVLCGGVQ